MVPSEPSPKFIIVILEVKLLAEDLVQVLFLNFLPILIIFVLPSNIKYKIWSYRPSPARTCNFTSPAHRRSWPTWSLSLLNYFCGFSCYLLKVYSRSGLKIRWCLTLYDHVLLKPINLLVHNGDRLMSCLFHNLLHILSLLSM